MPYIKISSTETGNNKGSCKQLAKYLDKENRFKSIEHKEVFFSHTRDYVKTKDVIGHIDKNKAAIGSNEAKFFMVTINPSEKELNKIGNDKDKLKEYTRIVMDEYAKSFMEKGTSKGLQGKDLVYYAKVEDNRYYKGQDSEVKSGKVKQGEIKPGNNMHVHVIVSRKDIENKKKLSPMRNDRYGSSKTKISAGFDRSGFKQQCEEKFDNYFNYKRGIDETYHYFNTMNKGNIEEKVALLEKEIKEKATIPQEQEKKSLFR